MIPAPNKEGQEENGKREDPFRVVYTEPREEKAFTSAILSTEKGRKGKQTQKRDVIGERLDLSRKKTHQKKGLSAVEKEGGGAQYER